MRWKLLCRGLALLLAGVVGCKQVVYVTEDDMNKFKDLGLPPNLANDPCVAVKPMTPTSQGMPDIFSPDRPIRYMSLAEAIAIALEQGTVGNQSTIVQNQFGSGLQAQQTGIDQPPSFLGAPQGRVGSSDSIRVLRLDPAIIGSGIEASLSKFDAVLQGSISWNGTDRPVATSTDVIETGGMNIPAIVEQDVTPEMSLVKPLPSGGVIGITYSMPYQSTNLPAAVNPSWRPDLQLNFEQPLLQGFGDEINQLRPNHPGSIITNPNVRLNTQPTAEGILITRVRFDQQRAELERNVHIMVTNTEIAYWNVYYAYWNLYAQEQGLRFAYQAWRLSVAKFDAGKATIADVGQTRGQYESFRALRLVALNDVLDQERFLRAMLGMQGDDGHRIVPSDQPTLAPFRPDWETAEAEALAMKPELVMARQEVKVAQMNLKVQKDLLLPDLRLGLTYDINGIGNRLDGVNSPGQDNALRELASNHFNNYSAELLLNVPIGFRAAHANVRIAQLELARSMETTKDAERKIVSFLIQQYRRVPLNYELIRIQRAARESFADQLRVRIAEYEAGKTVLDQLLEAQRFWANALSQEYLAIRDYNNALCEFEFAKGTILVRNNIVISEGMLPGFAQKRAVEHIAERNAALPIRERPNPIDLPTSAAQACDTNHTALENSAPALPTLFGTAPPLKDAPSLPSPTAMPIPAATKLAPMATSTSSTVPTTPKDDSRSLPSMPMPAMPAPTSSTFGTGRPMTPTLDGPALGSPSALPQGIMPQQ